MIVCKLELWPGGSPEGSTHLGTIFISNQLMETITTDGKRGTYKAELYKKRINKMWGRTTVRNFARESYHPWNLVRIILNQLAEKNGGKI